MAASNVSSRARSSQSRRRRFDAAERRPRKPIAPNVREVSVRLWAYLVSSAQALNTVADSVVGSSSEADLRRLRDTFAIAAGSDSFAVDLDFAHEEFAIYDRPNMLVASVVSAFASYNDTTMREAWSDIHRKARAERDLPCRDFLAAATAYLAQSGIAKF